MNPAAATHSLFPQSMLARLHSTAVIAVLVVEQPQQAVHIARALLAGGVAAMELTLRTPAALQCLKAVRSDVPEMIVGAGTIIPSEWPPARILKSFARRSEPACRLPPVSSLPQISIRHCEPGATT